MNYPTFLRNIDALTAGSDREKLCAFIHELAGNIPDSNREYFLTLLRNFCESAEKSPGNDSDNLPEKIDRILGRLEEIQENEIRLQSEYNNEWNCWNDDEWNEQYFFSDPEGILDDINEALSLIHKSVDHEEYSKGYALVLKLSELSLEVDGAYSDGEMNLDNLFSYQLLDGSFNTVMKESVFLACMGCGDDNPAEAMLAVIDNLHSSTVPLEEIIEMGDGKIDTASLLPLWIEALASRSGWETGKLLDKAVTMLDDDRLALDYASRYASTYPIIYVNVLRNGLHVTTEKMLEIGLRAMKEVREDSALRNDVCLYTAEYALKSGRQDIAENCWMEAFRTEPCVVDYLRLRLLTGDWDSYRDRVREVYTAQKNTRNISVLRFLDMDFEGLMSNLVVSEDCARSSSAMECVTLFLILLSDGATGEGMEAMLKNAVYESRFTTKGYTFGTDLEDDRPDTVLFSECFDRWKRDVTLDEAVCRKWIRNIDRWIQFYVQTAMDNNDRVCYRSCAQYIAALGEVEEKRGSRGAKQQLMVTYRKLYWRRRSFVDELVKFGFRK